MHVDRACIVALESRHVARGLQSGIRAHRVMLLARDLQHFLVDPARAQRVSTVEIEVAEALQCFRFLRSQVVVARQRECIMQQLLGFVGLAREHSCPGGVDEHRRTPIRIGYLADLRNQGIEGERGVAKPAHIDQHDGKTELHVAQAGLITRGLVDGLRFFVALRAVVGEPRLNVNVAL